MDSEFKVELVVSGLSKDQMQDLFESWVKQFSRRYKAYDALLVGYWMDISARQFKGSVRVSGGGKKGLPSRKQTPKHKHPREVRG